MHCIRICVAIQFYFHLFFLIFGSPFTANLPLLLTRHRNNNQKTRHSVAYVTLCTVAAHFESKFRAETVRKGHQIRLRCESFGDKPLTIVWLKDKLPFSPQDDPRYELTDESNAYGLSSEIVIRSADRRDSALFTCLTSNAYGHDDTNIQLITQGKSHSRWSLRRCKNRLTGFLFCH